MRSPVLQAALTAAVMFVAAPSLAADLLVYGPGGPAPAMKEVAAAFGEARGVDVEVTAGPTPQWIDKAKADADLVYSGSETMMSDFVTAMDGAIASEEVRPLYLRPSAILVRPGNPAGIGGLEDLFEEGHRVLVVNGAGQNGLWEDMAGRGGDIEKVRALRSNIAVVAGNSAEARQAWMEDETLDAWIIWNIWQRANPDLADLVEVEPEYRIYRDTGIVLTTRGKENTLAAEFAAYLESDEGGAIFEKWGWIVP